MKKHACWLTIVLAMLGCAQSPDAGVSGAVLASAQSGTPATRSMASLDAWPAQIDISLARSKGYLLVPGYVDGESIGMMMIDTGASLSVIAQGVAGRLKLDQAGRGKTVGVGGIEAFDYFKAKHFSIGRSTSADKTSGELRLTRQKMAGLSLLGFGRSLGVSLGGIVAYTDLNAVPFTLDAAKQKLTLYNPRSFRPPAGATRQRLERFRKLPMVRAELDDGNQRVEVWLIIDYGADNALTLPSSLLERYPGVVSVNASGAGRTHGIGGTVASTQTWVKNFRLFDLNLENIPVNFERPPPTMRGEKMIGRVGNGLLQHFRLTFHAPHGWVYAEWNPASDAAH